MGGKEKIKNYGNRVSSRLCVRPLWFRFIRVTMIGWVIEDRGQGTEVKFEGLKTDIGLTGKERSDQALSYTR